MGMLFSFQSQGSTAYSYSRPYCIKCGKLEAYTNFKGTPADTSYLELLREQTNTTEITAGEYYTITATISLSDSLSTKVKLHCKLENEHLKVGFSIEFRPEFKEAVSLLNTGETITFRGRYYDTGCGFTDCELIE